MIEHQRSHMPRTGLSLVEVLIAIAVLAGGLLAIGALIPLAHYQARLGIQKDRQAVTGKRVLREFRIRGMANPVNWRYPVWSRPVDAFVDPYFVSNSRRDAYCLDPLTIAAQLDNETDQSVGNASESVGIFPLVPVVTNGGTLNMKRISLAIDPNLPTRMSLAQATSVFTLEDDLLFEIPDDEGAPPRQKWLRPGLVEDQSVLPERRAAEGNFSWFATLVPSPNPTSDDYRLSLVITHKRIPTEDWKQEMVGNIRLRGGIAGGDVRLEFPLAQTLDTYGQPLDGERFEFKKGMWLLLAQFRQGGTSPGSAEYAWYRIIKTARAEYDQPVNSTLLSQEVTLQGADWPTLGETKAIYVPRVVAVYEKTIKLETSTLWNGFSDVGIRN